MGYSPLAFRPGNFSANDETFAVIREVGFTHGSVSQPERSINGYKAVWKGASRNVHKAHSAFRLIEGDLDFVEVPVTVAVEMDTAGNWTGTGDIRLEYTSLESLDAAVCNEIKRQTDEKASFKHLCFFTHNFVAYSDDTNDSRGKLLADLAKKLPEIADKNGFAIKGATIRSVRNAFITNNSQSQGIGCKQ